MSLTMIVKDVPVDESQCHVGDLLEQYPRIMIEAAPGTGKTFTGVYLALKACKSGLISPNTPALFLTFSKNARVQIENEIRNYRQQGWMTSEQAKMIEVQNYHAFFFEWLNKRGGVWGIPTPATPCSLNENNQFVKGAKVKKNELKKICQPFCRMNNSDVLSQDSNNKIIKMALTRIRKGRPDYDDFAPLACHLISFSELTKKWLRIKYPLVILDEFQDSDCCQWYFLQQWNPERVAIFYDRYQSIYTWRKADTDRPEEVACHWNIVYDACTTLTTPHRSGGDLANYFIDLRKDNLKGRYIKKNNYKPFIKVINLEQGYYDGDVMGPIRDKLRNKVIAYKDETTAVICQFNLLTNYLLKQLQKRPRSGKGRYFPCRAISSEGSEEKLRDYIYYLPECGSADDIRNWLADVFVMLLLPSVENTVKERLSREQISMRKPSGSWEQVSRILQPIWDELSVDNPGAFISALHRLSDIAKILADGKAYPDYEALFYIKHITQRLKSYQAECIGDIVEPMQSALLQASYLYLRKPPRGLFILNAHQAKGREFDHVIIPLLSGTGEPEFIGKGAKCKPYCFDKEEDRRLLYVAMTRAKKRITIMYPEDDPSEFIEKWQLQ